MKVVVAPLAALLVLAAATACGEDEAGSPTPESLQDVPWMLASGVDAEGWEEVAPSATFMDGRVAGSTGCNQFTAPYTLDGSALEIGQIASTRMACGPPGDTVEREYVAALGQVAAWRSEGDELTLLDGDENEVLGYRVGTPEGSWEVTGMRQADAIVSPIRETQITASFGEDGTLSGSAGCNTYTAAYTTNKGEIEITEPASTKKACTEPEGIMKQEAAYLAALPTAVGFRVSGRTLELLTAEETPLLSYSRKPPP
jgi:heat shock protein HslJ